MCDGQQEELRREKRRRSKQESEEKSSETCRGRLKTMQRRFSLPFTMAKLKLIKSGRHQDRLGQMEETETITDYPVPVEMSREARRRHTHVAAISLEGEEKIDRLEDSPANWEEAILDDEFVEVVLQKWKKKDHRPTFKEMHAEDGKRRPSVTEY